MPRRHFRRQNVHDIGREGYWYSTGPKDEDWERVYFASELDPYEVQRLRRRGR